MQNIQIVPKPLLSRALAQQFAGSVALGALGALTSSAAIAQCAPSPAGANPAQVVCAGTVPANGAQFTTGAFTGNLDVKVNANGIITTGVLMRLTDSGSATFTTLPGAAISNTTGIGVNIQTTSGAIALTGTGGAITSGATGTGISATASAGGNVGVATAATVNAGANGIVANSSGAGTVVTTSGVIGGTSVPSVAGISATAQTGATTITANANITAGATSGVGILATTTTGGITIGGTGTVTGGAGIVATANATTIGGIDSGGVTILRTGAVTGNAPVTNPTPPYVGSNGDGIYVVTNGGSINIGNMTSVTGKANGVWARTGGTGNTTQIVNAGTVSVHDIGSISSAGGLDSAVRGWGGGGVTVQNIGAITGFLDGIHMTAIGTPANSNFLAQNITSITAQTRSGIQVTATGNLTVASVGNVTAIVDGIVLTSQTTAGVTQAAGNINVDTIGTITTAATASGGTGLLLNAQHGSITVNKVAGISSNLEGVNAAASGSIGITGSTGNITSQTANGIFANASAGDATIQNNRGISGGKSAIVALAANAVLIDRNTSLTGSSDNGVFGSGNSVTFSNNGPASGGKDGVTLSGITSVSVLTNGTITGRGGAGLNVNASGGDVTIQGNGAITGTTTGMSAGGTGAVKIIGNGDITGSSGDGINTYNLPGGTPSILVQGNGNIHGNTNGINAGAIGSVAIIGNGKIDGHDGVSMTINTGGTVVVQNNTAITGNTEGAFINAGGNVTVSGNGSVFGGTLNGITVITSGGATFANNGPIYGNISGINITAANNIAVTSTNSITGATGSGMNLQSSNGSISIDQSNGAIIGTNTGFKTQATAVGATTGITNQASGYIQAATALDVTSGTGTVTINNAGTLNGAQVGIKGQSGGGAFNINNTGTINGAINVTGAQVATSTFTNAGNFDGGTAASSYTGNISNTGTLRPGPAGTAPAMTIAGNYTQSALGRLAVDANWTTGNANKLNIGGTANLAGTVVVNPISFGTTGGLNKQFTILHANGGVTANGLAATNTAAVTYALLYPNANDVVLSATINVQGTTSSQAGIAGAVNTLVASGSSNALTTAILRQPTSAALGNSLNQLLPGGNQQSPQNVQFVGAFNNAMLSCRINGEGVAMISEGQCVWMRARTLHTEVDASSRHAAFREHMDQISAGAQLALATNWRAGFALGYDTSTTTADTSRTQGERVTTGGVVKFTEGPWLLAASVSGGWGFYDRTRTIAFDGFSATATSSPNVDFIASRLHAAYLIDLGRAYLKPMLDGGITRVIRESYTEQGGNGAGLAVAGSTSNVWSISPAVELGTQVTLGELALRPFVKAGATFLDPADVAVTASFISAPSAAFATTARYDSALFDVGAGFDLLNGTGSALRLQYDGKFGPTTEQHSFSVKGSLPF